MTRIKSISVPQPCSQTWQQMDARENGRHCEHCAKVVVDFTKMTNDELLGYLAAEKHVCGRFNQFQLPNINYELGLENLPKRLGWKKWVAAAGLLGTSMVNRAMAQATPANQATTQQGAGDSSRQSYMLGKVATANTISQHLTGVVIGADDKLPVPGAYVKIKGTNTGVQTDTQGRFKLYIGSGRPVLVVSYIGYQTRELEVPAAHGKDLIIAMQPSQMTMGEVVIVQPKPVPSRVLMFYQYMPWPINRLFR